MGPNVSVQNHKYHVRMDLEDTDSILSFKVRDRKNLLNPTHFVHYKRYKHFQLPIQLKKKFKSVREVHRYLFQNGQKISLGESDVILDIDGQQIRIPFVNVNTESMIFRDQENQQIQKKNQNGDIQIIFGSRRGPGTDSDNCNLEGSKKAIRRVLSRLANKNNPTSDLNVEALDLDKLVQTLQKQWDIFEKNGCQVPNMLKNKGYNQNKIQELKGQIQSLKIRLTQESTQKKILQTQYKEYKSQYNFDKFVNLMKNSMEDLNKIKQKTLNELLGQISNVFNQLGININKSNIPFQIITKDALFAKIKNIITELNDLRAKLKKIDQKIQF